jgi:phospholipid/cholesterol/gamma-HCH transport system substrate-binding protein
MKRNIIETFMGAVVLIVAAGFLVFFSRTTDMHPETGYQLKASFSKIDGLESGSPVRVSGVKVGSVTGFDLDKESFQAIVRINISDDKLRLPRDTAAVIASDGLLGGKFMSLEPGSDDEMLENGGTIEYTQSTPSLEQLLGQVIFSLTNKKDGDASGDAAAPAAATPAKATP